MGDTYIGAIDQGTKGTRFVVFDRDGNIVGNAYERHEQLSPQPGWVEHDPVEIWLDVKKAVTSGLSSAGISSTQLAALGITNQRETTLLWDRETGSPVYNAIVWQDQRTDGRIRQLADDGKVEWIRDKTGLEPDSFFSAVKAEWLLDNADPIKQKRARPGDIRDRASAGELCFGTIDAWLIYNLTGNHLTDVSNASRTMLFDIDELAWDDELLAEFRIPEPVLPEVRPSSDEQSYGSTDPDGFLGAEIPVTGVLGDQQAALFGQTCFEAGDAKNTYGTGSFYLMNTGDEPVSSDHGLLTTIGFQLSGEPVQYALEGPMFTTGDAIAWLGDVGFINTPMETEDLASSIESTEGVYFVPSFSGLGAPYWDAEARGTLVGLTRGTRREHVVRATLESIAYQTREIAEAMEADAGVELSSLRVDGGAVKNDYFCQLQSDLIQTGIVRPQVDETTALGAAYVAGLAVDYWDDFDQLRAHWRVDSQFKPEMEPEVATARYDRWEDAVECAREWELP